MLHTNGPKGMTQLNKIIDELKNEVTNRNKLIDELDEKLKYQER